MKRLPFLFLVLAFITLACNALSQSLPFVETPTPTAADINLDPNCPSSQPTQDLIDFALGHHDEYFRSPDWKMSYTVMESRVSVTRKNDALGAVVNFDHVIFCDATSARLDEYYTDSIFDIIFQNYQEHEVEDECRSSNVRLYEFKVKSQGFDYNARFWIELVDGDHTRESLLVFPVADLVNLDSFSEKIMPGLPSCD